MEKNKSELTPLMRQFWDVKDQHPDKLLLFRMGDFYELFYEDAQKAAPVLGIVLTSRNKKSADQTPMCGVPHHSLAVTVNKLLSHGYKVAICDQVEDAKLAKGIVRREITKILTPGMVYDFDSLESSKSHFLVSIDSRSVAFFDASTFESFFILYDDLKELKKILHTFDIQEILMPFLKNPDHEVPANTNTQEFLVKEIKDKKNITITEYQSTWEGFSFSDDEVKTHLTSITQLKKYLVYLNPSWAKQASELTFPQRSLSSCLKISAVSFQHLEIFESYQGQEQSSLFGVLNQTKTSLGARLLKSWLRMPLTNKDQIELRQKQVQFYLNDHLLLKVIREKLALISDIERKIAKISHSQCIVRDVLSLSESVIQSVGIKELINTNISSDAQLLNDFSKIRDQFNEDAPLSLKNGGLFKKNIYIDLDEWIDLATNSQSLVQELEKNEREKTGISSLKIRYNQVFGFYIEVTHTHSEKVPENYKRKQTLTNAERYYTDELLELEKKVLQAQTRRNELEYQYFEEVRNEILLKTPVILELARFISEVDVICTFAWISLMNNYQRPLFYDEFEKNSKLEKNIKSGNKKSEEVDNFKEVSLKIVKGRHPVVEKINSDRFVPNSVEIRSGHCWLITGPNMAGKSTLMRQVALIQIMAQIGCYVPAQECLLPVLESLHTRIGASDKVSEGMSTFMVEMIETADMLKEASRNSLVLLDEIGRGTATYDGLSLAQSITEYLIENVKSYTLFATHYHELTTLDKKFTAIKNKHMSILEKEGQIHFQHLLKDGAARKSYGIHVAELAGMPEEITRKAKLYLEKIENDNERKSQSQIQCLSESNINSQSDSDTQSGSHIDCKNQSQLSLFIQEDTSLNKKEREVITKIKKLNFDLISPIQALNFLYEFKDQL